MAILLPNGKQAFTSVLGLPLVGGRVYTYAAGTNTPQATYADAAGTVPNANPVILDARGEATIFWNGAYKVILRDFLDNLIWSVDNISTPISVLPQLAIPGGSALVGFDPGEASDVNRSVQDKLRELSLSPQDFGAKGDGVTDDSDAFDLWITALRNTDQAGFIPKARYRLTRAQVWRPRTTGFPTHSLTIRGESMDGTVLAFDYAATNPCLEINPPYDINDPAGYTGLESGYIGNFTVEEADGQFHTSLIRAYNSFNTVFENLRLRNNGVLSPRGTSEYATEVFRITSGMQFAIFRNCIVDPFGVGGPANPQGQQSYYGTGFSIGNGYRDGPQTNQYAISSNKFYSCRAYHCHFGFLTEAADGTSLYDPVMVQNDWNYVDRAAVSTVYYNPWCEGERVRGFAFANQFITDSTGTSLRSTAYAQLIGGYVGSVLLANTNGVYVRAAINQLDIGAGCQDSRVDTLGPRDTAYTGLDNDCIVTRYDTTINKRVTLMGNRGHVSRTPANSEYELSDTGVFGYSFKRPQAGGLVAGYRVEVGDSGLIRTYSLSGPFNNPGQTLISISFELAHYFYKPVQPGTDNNLTLGASDARWSTVYAGTATINTSDAREKQQVKELSERERAAAVRLKGLVRSFRFNDAVEEKGDDARIHVGVIAQEVVAAFAAEGLDATRYALLCHDEWTARDAIGEGDDAIPAREAGDRYGVRYDELLAFIIGAL